MAHRKRKITIRQQEAKIEFFIENIYRYFDILDITVDHIIIDECQDFQTEWLESLELANTYNPEGRFYMFGDPGQSSITNWSPSFDSPSFKLTKNLRNSHEINQFINGYFKTGVSSEMQIGNVDLIVLILITRTNKIMKLKIAIIIKELTSKDVDMSQIAVLGLHKSHTEKIRILCSIIKTI